MPQISPIHAVAGGAVCKDSGTKKVIVKETVSVGDRPGETYKSIVDLDAIYVMDANFYGPYTISVIHSIPHNVLYISRYRRIGAIRVSVRIQRHITYIGPQNGTDIKPI